MEKNSKTPNPNTVRYAGYILNHYSRDSYKDILCLAKDLEKKGVKFPEEDKKYP